ncbi:aliphatic sulfonate ABC transporter substrate-binding protein [Azospirillum sp. RWY-5-1]|uniref:Aliphatic sulfonate ABC transporter substrate-binding protein n=1 Tax=Azospirillum oleiclasticum TaxID=2735135 RepID=A0ABX2TJN2_9PROT|nr:aliphatic sulfonate ABC transporter substrate-binding protein [Azospirillum oleiclasticum]NYZ16349.1 aliphatic sulfonate ABC transporter substrate-binding protein [Azospirillum oleiclasticum]NYZ23935.1 aliphatic sulfonate ABC transporter substrate-binding protein [Azospirillum oleiclasticum]
MSFQVSRRAVLAAAVAAPLASSLPFPVSAADKPSEIRLDYAYYNPVSLLLKENGWLEEELKKDGIGVRWVLSLGSNKALEFLNARGLDFGSTAGAAALVAKVNGNPIKSVYVYSKPEWTALVTRGDSGITKVADLKGKRIAVTRGTDPHIFLVRALAGAGLTDKDAKLVLLQHQDGRLALEKGDVDAWAGLDPMMAQAELENGAKLFYRNPDANTWGILNVREAFAAENPALVTRVLAVYERARKHALANPAELRKILAAAAKQPDTVIARQLERTDLTHAAIGPAQERTIIEAGLALQEAGVLAATVDVKAVAASLFDASFTKALGQ